MGDPDRRRRSRSGRVLDALIWGVALGAASGAVLVSVALCFSPQQVPQGPAQVVSTQTRTQSS